MHCWWLLYWCSHCDSRQREGPASSRVMHSSALASTCLWFKCRKLFRRHGFFFQQEEGTLFQVPLTLLQCCDGLFVRFINQVSDRIIDLSCRGLGVGARRGVVYGVAKVAGALLFQLDVDNFRCHAVAGDNLLGEIGYFYKVVGSPG